ncbi:MAG TPA: prephenate dehydrogenase [Microlunatus sp.]|nr:prephenate dehydrogenase [Microlunatus sp.]
MSTGLPEAETEATPRVVVIGVGLIGGSIGSALSHAGWSVHLRDTKSSHARVGESLGAGTVAAPVAEAVDLVVVAVPPRALATTVGAALEEYPNATVTDVGSVKAEVLGTVWGHRELHRYVGSHPMAGTQHSGPTAARADLFADRTWVITPHRRSDPGATRAVTRLALTCRARPVIMDVDDHDAAVARVSHLPHLMSVLTAGHLTTMKDQDLALAGPGLRDVTRIAGSDPGLWEQILTANSHAVLTELRQVSDDLQSLIAAIEHGADGLEGRRDTLALRSRLARGVAGTRRIPGKHGAPSVTYQQVVIEIPDTPGALATLFADVGAAGVNVEDVAIEHDQNRQVGYLALSIEPEAAAGLVELMTARGWNVQP